MELVLFAILCITLVVALVYALRYSAPVANPYADFDRWQECFNAGIEARCSGLDSDDNPFLPGTRDNASWQEGYELAAGCSATEVA